MKVDVFLSEELAKFVNAQVASGRYASTADVIFEALFLLEDQDKLANEGYFDLRRAWKDGIESGDLQDLDFDAIKLAGQKHLKATK